jgi:hypothetical protein
MRTFLILALAFLTFASPALAAQGNTLGGSANTNNTTGSSLGGSSNTMTVQGDRDLINPLGEDASLEGLLEDIIAIFIRIGTLVIITMIIYIGFLFVAAQGAPEKISNARNMLLWTLIGGLILLGAQAIATGIRETVEDISGKPTTQQTTNFIP